jgi:hypothetical protein
MENKEEQFRKIISGNKEKTVHICRYYAPTPDDQMDIYQEILMNKIHRIKETLRERVKGGRYLFMLPSILLIDAALVISEISEWTTVELLNRILYVQAFYIPIMLISAFTGYLIWRRKQKPIRDAALRLLEELKG